MLAWALRPHCPTAPAVVGAVRRWLDLWDYPGEIIVGSSRTRMNLQEWACAGAHILTITPALLEQMLVNARTKETVAQFLGDAEKALRRPDEGVRG